MENAKNFKTPKKTLVNMQVVHLGKILFNLQFIAVAVMFASVLSFLLPAIYYLMLLCISLLTLFTIYAAYPNFKNLWKGGETLTKIAEVMAQSWQYTIPIALALSVASIICLCFDRRQKHTARIVVSAVIAALAVFVLILKLINNGAK